MEAFRVSGHKANPGVLHVCVGVNVAETVTPLFGIVKVQGLLNEPSEQDAPVTVQLENTYPEATVAVTETEEPIASAHLLGQFGETEPEPEATFVVKLCPVVEVVEVVFVVEVVVEIVVEIVDVDKVAVAVSSTPLT